MPSLPCQRQQLHTSTALVETHVREEQPFGYICRREEGYYRKRGRDLMQK